jgi:hypothetical protein
VDDAVGLSFQSDNCGFRFGTPLSTYGSFFRNFFVASEGV